VIAALVRGLVLLSLASAIGGLVLGLLFPASAAPDLDVARARLRRWVATCLVILLVATWAELLVRTQAMSGASLGASVAAVPSVLAGTHFGQILAARGAAVVVALLLSAERSRAFQAFVLLVAAGIALSVSLTGHAADWGDVTLAVAIDWAHAVAASAWTGGLIALALVAGRREAPWSRESLAVVVPRFSRLAGLSLLAVAVTGGYNAWTQLGRVARLSTTTYGRVLIAKLAIVAVLVWLGAVNRYVLVPRLAPSSAARGVGARVFRIARLAVLGPSRGAGRIAGGRLRHGRGARRARGVRVHGGARRSHPGPPRDVRAQDDDPRGSARALGRCRAATRHRDAAAGRRRARTCGLRPPRVRHLSRGAGPELRAPDTPGAGSGGHRRPSPGRAHRVDHESERADPRRAGVYGRARPVDHARL